MLDLSVSVMVAWEFSLSETVASNYEYILVEHMFNGILKLQDIAEAQLEFLTATQNERYQSEIKALLGVAEQAGLDPTKGRRMMRVMLGDGGYHRTKSEVFHRDNALKEAFQRAESLAEIHGESVVGVHRLLYALLEVDNNLLPRLMQNLDVDSSVLSSLLEALTLYDLLAHPEAEEAHQNYKRPIPPPVSPPTNPEGNPRPPTSSQKPPTQSVIERYGRDLTALAREGKLSDVFERDAELRDIILVLSRADKNNPVLTGEAGVGKTAIVEGLAYRIAHGMVPVHLRDRRIIEIDPAALVGGTEYRGAFEQRMTQIIDEAISSGNIILFMDEIHTLVGIGGANLDAANILKPAMARHGFALIGATTTAEYNRFIDKDRALDRRFSPINISEPSREATIRILQKGVNRLQSRHQNKVRITQEAIEATVRLSGTYMPERRFPDKAFELLDDACALARVGLDMNFEDENLRGSDPIDVTAEYVRSVVERHGIIPDEDEWAERLRGLDAYLRSQVIGQNEAIRELVNAIQLSYLGFKRKGSPVGVFMFVGPTGVGKTQLVKAVAECLYNDENAFIRIDMSEYLEKHSLSRLIGSPPGYIGFEESGQLTGRLRTTPGAVVLLDEIEKAHPDVCNVFLQVFSDGRLTDGRGRTIDASRALFIMTSNLGFEQMGGDQIPLPSREEIERSVEWHFRPEFIGRIDKIVHFSPLRREFMLEIVDVHFNQLRKRVLQQQNVSLELTSEAREWLAENGHDMKRGAREVIRLIDRQITQPLGGMFFAGTLHSDMTLQVMVSDDGQSLVLTTGDDTTL